jgi:hypothetical protein
MPSVGGLRRPTHLRPGPSDIRTLDNPNCSYMALYTPVTTLLNVHCHSSVNVLPTALFLCQHSRNGTIHPQLISITAQALESAFINMHYCVDGT